MTDFIDSALLMLTLLNPFLVIIYLIDVVQKLDRKMFGKVLFRAATIASGVFCGFTVLGDAVFSFFGAEFASFQIFGGVVFIVIGLQFVLRGPTAIEVLRGESQHLAGAVAMPVLIGPGTISASVIVGEKLQPLLACGAVVAATATSILIIFGLKLFHDYVRPRNETLVQRYIEVAGRLTALYVGTVAVEMIMRGLRTWSENW